VRGLSPVRRLNDLVGACQSGGFVLDFHAVTVGQPGSPARHVKGGSGALSSQFRANGDAHGASNHRILQTTKRKIVNLVPGANVRRYLAASRLTWTDAGDPWQRGPDLPRLGLEVFAPFFDLMAKRSLQGPIQRISLLVDAREVFSVK